VPARSKARKRALDILFEAEVRGEPVLDMLEQRIIAASPWSGSTRRNWSAASRRTASGSTSCWKSTPRAGRWTGCRSVDRNVLRIGLYELLWADDVPDGESDQRGRAGPRPVHRRVSAFVNGLLAHLLELKPTLTA
jgi:N utilization substance protein B